MARIRTIKPEFWTSEQVAECSTKARLLFIGLWNFCDDQGIHPASARRLKMEVFPADPFSTDEIEAMVQELLQAGLIVHFEVDGREYWIVTGWNHQKIDRPNPKYPLPSEGRILSHSPSESRQELDDNSTNDRRAIGDHSPPEGKGREEETERKGRGKEGSPHSPRKRGVVLVETPRELPKSINTPEVRGAISEWIVYRAEKKRSITAQQLAKLISQFEEWGADRAIRAVNHSILGGYSGLFEPGVRRGDSGGGDAIIENLRRAKENRDRREAASGI
jgi:hypothetical protein